MAWLQGGVHTTYWMGWCTGVNMYIYIYTQIHVDIFVYFSAYLLQGLGVLGRGVWIEVGTSGLGCRLAELNTRSCQENK